MGIECHHYLRKLAEACRSLLVLQASHCSRKIWLSSELDKSFPSLTISILLRGPLWTISSGGSHVRVTPSYA